MDVKEGCNMRAAVLRRFSEPLDVTEVHEPQPGEGEVLVKVIATGICGTDNKIAAGAFSHLPLPLILGHEVAGVLAEDDGELKRGQRVACFMYKSCGLCRWCRGGEEILCPDPPRIGFNRDGGLAEYIGMPRDCVLPFADHVSFEQAAICMDAILTPWRALMVRGRVQPGESVVVVGAGGLGLNGVQVARAAGARVAAVDPLPAHRDEALRLGAELAVAPEQLDRVLDWAPGGADVVFEASGVREGLDSAAACVTPGGRLVCCGWRPGADWGLQSRQLVLKEISVLGSRAGNRTDARAALRALERGDIAPISMESVRLDDINEALARLKKGDVTGRFVVEIGTAG
jgi:propanol-preferring alcohol dehydrogenase